MSPQPTWFCVVLRCHGDGREDNKVAGAISTHQKYVFSASVSQQVGRDPKVGQTGVWIGSWLHGQLEKMLDIHSAGSGCDVAHHEGK